jgi:hypothetical protein
MDTTFPFGFPTPTAFYLTLYVLTFALHQAFMHYVLAGTLYLTWATIFFGPDPIPRTEKPLAATLRDWIPFLLSAAITAGVAPLLFIQIVYQHQFYTANLLLWWRWMVIVPVLIAAFYLSYLLKSRLLWKWPHGVRVVVAATTSVSFLFVGFCWTANHLLANRADSWPEVYVTGQLPFSPTEVVLRMLVWIGGAFASMSVITGWQLFSVQTAQADDLNRFAPRPLAGMAIGGLAVALVSGTVYFARSNDAARTLILGNLIRPYLILAASGAILQLIGWSQQWRSPRLSFAGLTMATSGAVVTLLSVSVIREGFRISAVNLVGLAQRHADAAQVGGFGVFVVAAILVTLSIFWCVRLVQTGKIT